MTGISDSMRIKDGEKVPDGFVYASDTNTDWMSDKTFKFG